MSQADLTSLLVIIAVSALVPVLCDLMPGPRIASVVLEIGLGIVVGPQVLGLAHFSPTIRVISTLGMGALFFLAGYEIDFHKIRGRPITLALGGWLLSLALSFAVGGILFRSGLIISSLIIAVTLCTTSLGTLMPILRDSGELDTGFGAFVVAAGSAGEFGPIVLVSLLLSGADAFASAALLITFTVVAVAGAVVALRVHPHYAVNLLRRTMNTSTQLPLRFSILILVVLVYLTQVLGLDAILGAFAAGILVSLAASGPQREILHLKLEGLAFGFFVPIFFVTSGMQFDLNALISSGSGIIRLPLFLLLFLVVRGLPAVLYRGVLPRIDLAPLALLSSTTLPLVVAITDIGVQTHRMRPDNAAALVGAGMVSVFVYPVVALAIRRAGAHRLISTAGTTLT